MNAERQKEKSVCPCIHFKANPGVSWRKSQPLSAVLIDFGKGGEKEGDDLEKDPVVYTGIGFPDHLQAHLRFGNSNSRTNVKQTMSLNQIREAGLEALTKALGPVGMICFLQQFERGTGDYTKNREKWLKGISLQSILKENKRKHTKR